MASPSQSAAPVIRSVGASGTMAGLVTTTLSVPADASVRTLEEVFEKHPGLDSVAVVEPGRVRLVSRARFFIQLGTRFGYAVFENRPVGLLAEEASTVDGSADPLEVIHLALQRESSRIYDDLVVLEGGRYRGLVSMRSLISHHKDLLLASMAEVSLLEESNRRLEDLNRVQSEFVANVTHELRSPLNVILGAGHLLFTDPGFPDAHRRHVALILSRGRELLSTVDNMLDLAKIEAGAMRPYVEAVALEPVLEDVLESARALVTGSPVRLHVHFESLPPTFVTDPIFLKRILMNLLTNAVKFTPAGSVTLGAQGAPGRLLLQVADTGVGIAAEDIPLLFRKFSQLESTKTRRHGGTGLGLAIVKGLVDALGGSITVESHPGTGSTFTTQLPEGRR